MATRLPPGVQPIEPMFFEDYSLYRAFQWDAPNDARKLDEAELYPAVKLACPLCKCDQTFRVGERYLDGEAIRHHDPNSPHAMVVIDPPPSANSIIVLSFVCKGCDQYHCKFMYQVSGDGKSIRKVGQSSPLLPRLDSLLESRLGDHAELFKKGQTCEAFGYGIGAFGYYRRILESLIGSLLDDIRGVFSSEVEKERYDQALANIEDSQSAASRIAVVKDLVPLQLRPDGLNPLEILYASLSSGLHQWTDEQCLADASKCRDCLVFLLLQTASHRENTREFVNSIRSLQPKLEKHGRSKRDVK